MLAVLIALLALPPQLLWAAADVTRQPPGHAPEALALPALTAPTLSAPASIELPSIPGAPEAAAVAPQAVEAAAAGTPLAETAGADPRGPGFERRAWTQAERLGFVHAAAPVEDLPAGDAPASPQASLSAPPSSPSPSRKPPEPPEPRRILSRGVLGFFSSFALIQVTVESLGLAVPQMTDPLKAGFLALGALSAISYVAYSLGSLVGGKLVERFGIRKVYPAVLVTRALVWTAAAMLFDPTLQTVPIVQLTALFSLDYFAHSIGRVSEHTLQVAWFKGSPVASSRFGTIRDFFEYGTVFAMLGTGVLIASFGFGAVVYATPFMFGAAALISLFLKSLPGPTTAEHAVKGFWTGFKALFAVPELRRLFIGQVLLNNFFYLLYYVTATAFSVFAAHGDPAQAALVSSALTGAYGLGALGGTFVMTAISQRIDKRTAALPADARSAAQASLLTRSASTALIWAAAALLGAWLFLSQVPLGTMIWPVYLVTPALALIGLTAQVALNQLDVIFKDRLPAESAANIVGAVRTLTYLSYAASFIVWGAIFQLLVAQGFLALAVYSTAVAAAYVWLALKLRR